MNTHTTTTRTRRLAAIIAAAALTAAACSSGSDEQAADGVTSVVTTEAASTSGTEPAATTTKPVLPPTTTTTIVPLETIPYWAYDPDAPESVSPEYSGDSGIAVNTDNTVESADTGNSADTATPTIPPTTVQPTTEPTRTTEPAATTTSTPTRTTEPAATTTSTPTSTEPTSTTSIPVDVELEDLIGNEDDEWVLETYTGIVITDPACEKALIAWWDALEGEPDGLIAARGDKQSIEDMAADELRALRKASDLARIAWRNAHRVCGEVVDDVDGLFHANEHKWAHNAVQGSGLLDVDAALKGYWCTIDMHEANEHRGSLCDEVNDPYIAPHRRENIYAPTVYE